MVDCWTYQKKEYKLPSQRYTSTRAFQPKNKTSPLYVCMYVCMYDTHLLGLSSPKIRQAPCMYVCMYVCMYDTHLLGLSSPKIRQGFPISVRVLPQRVRVRVHARVHARANAAAAVAAGGDADISGWQGTSGKLARRAAAARAPLTRPAVARSTSSPGRARAHEHGRPRRARRSTAH